MKGAIPMAETKKPVATVKVQESATVATKPVTAAAPVATAKKEEAKPAAEKKETVKKATTKKAAAKKTTAKKTTTAAAKKPAEKKATTKKAAEKKAELKTSAVFSLDEGVNLTADALMKQYLKSAKDRTKYDLNLKSTELKSIDIYVNVKEQTVYSVVTKTDGTVINDQFPM